MMMEDKKKSKDQKFGFMIRFMQLSCFVERKFHCESSEERREWMEAYTAVQNDVQSKQGAAPAPTDGSAAGGAATKQYALSDFEMLKVLGKGTFGKVMMAKEKGTQDL